MKTNKKTREFKEFLKRENVRSSSGENKTNQIKKFWSKNTSSKKKGKSKPEIGLAFKEMYLNRKKNKETKVDKALSNMLGYPITVVKRKRVRFGRKK